jgi:hypothetical protein
MEVDFSSKLKSFFGVESDAASRPGPKSAAQTPSKPSEKRKGSDKNSPDSASSDSDSKIVFTEKIINSLQQKVSDHNEKYDKKVTLNQLKKVYRRGLGAFSASHRPGQTRNSWAMARVNMFLKMQKGSKVKDSYRAADQDIARGEELYYEQKPEDCFWQFDSIDFDLARIDLIKAGVNLEQEGDIELDDIDYTEAEKKTLNKPFRLPSGSNKKFGVYVKNDKGNVVMVKFGDPNMEIRRDDPERRKSFRARHQCDTNVGPKWKARYWSCKFWSAKPVSSMASAEELLLSDDDSLDWGWDDSTFIDQDQIFTENPDLENIEDFFEEEEL